MVHERCHVTETRHVLLVEDDAGIREFMAELLVDEGYDVTQAGDGNEGLAALDRHPPDVIVLDLMMPNLDGFGFRAGQRLRPNAREIPVILITARRSLGPDVEALEVDAILPKPFEVDTLISLLSRIAPSY
jgi:two-component system, OmpR family, response regulator MprA